MQKLNENKHQYKSYNQQSFSAQTQYYGPEKENFQNYYLDHNSALMHLEGIVHIHGTEN